MELFQLAEPLARLEKINVGIDFRLVKEHVEKAPVSNHLKVLRITFVVFQRQKFISPNGIKIKIKLTDVRIGNRLSGEQVPR